MNIFSSHFNNKQIKLIEQVLENYHCKSVL